MRISRGKYTHIDGREEESVSVSDRGLDNPDAVEQLGHELLQAAAEWRAEIAARVPEPPAFKTFDFISNYNRQFKVASWIEHPWALVRFSKGTSIAFLVKERVQYSGKVFETWIVYAKLENGEHRWSADLGARPRLRRAI